MPPPVVCLFGPTGTGKSELALQLARDFAIEIVSVDSAMVYRHMDIGTAKPPAAIRAAAPHWLVDIRDPWDTYSAGLFRADALHAIRDIQGRGRVPLLVGGTMLYFRTLFRGLASLPAADAAVRAVIDSDAAERGWPALHEELRKVDAQAATRIGPDDRQRIQRALEVFRLTGRPISELQARVISGESFRFLRIALIPVDRQELNRRLEARLASMMRSGFVAEVAQLMRLPLMTADSPAMRAVGYRQIWRHLTGELGLSDAVREAATATRRLAKRQVTWLRSEAADLRIDATAEGCQRVVEQALARAGVSRLTGRCNMIEEPLEFREHGV